MDVCDMGTQACEHVDVCVCVVSVYMFVSVCVNACECVNVCIHM